MDRCTDFAGNDTAFFGPGSGAVSGACSVVANATKAFLANLEALSNCRNYNRAIVRLT